MVAKRGKIIFISFLLLVVVFVAPFVQLFTKKTPTAYAEATVEDFEIAEEFSVGETLQVPDTVVLRIDENTTVNATESIIQYPNGVIAQLKSQLLTEKGKYTLQFKGEHADTKVKAEKSFYVKDGLYSLSDPNVDKAEFKTADAIKNGDLMGKDGAKKSAGIEVSVGQGEYFRYNKSVNLYDLPKDENGRTDLCTYYPILEYLKEDGKYGEIGRLATVKLIDCYDESNFVEIYMCNRFMVRNGAYYYCAGASYQTLTGLNELTTGTFNFEGKLYSKITTRRYQADSYGARSGNQQGTGDIKGTYGYTSGSSTWNGVYGAGGLNLQYDLETQRIYVNNRFVNDLDAEEVYPDNPFTGFTTGEVYIQFEFPNAKSAVEFQITSLFDLEGEELANGLAKDDTAPKVKINLKKAEAINVPTGKEFAFPSAEVFDVSGVKSIKKAVYTDYFTDVPKLVYSDGESFTPDKNTQYTIVYMATDKNGNKNVDKNGKCLDYITVNSISSDIIAYDKNNKITALSAGANNEIPYLDVTSKNGEVTTTLLVVNPKGEEEDISYTLSGESYHFASEYVGEYTIKYLFDDGVFTEEFAYKVNSNDVNAILFSDRIQLPSVLIKNAIYDIAPYFSYSASTNGLAASECEIWVSNDGGEFAQIADISKYEVTATTTATFKAKIGDTWSDFAQECNIVDVNFNEEGTGKKVYENYFHGYDAVTLSPNSIDYTFAAGQNKKLTYATPIARKTFVLEFSVNGSGMKEFSIQLKDISAKDNVGYEITYKYDTNARFQYKVASLDGRTVYYDGFITGEYYGAHSLSVSDGKLTNSEGKTVNLGESESRYVEFSIFAKEVTEDAQIYVSKLCNTAFNKDIYEMPLELCFVKPMGSYTTGMKYTLPEFYVSSVFYPLSNSNLTYTLRGKSSGVRIDENGKPLENINCGDGKTYAFVGEKAENYSFTFKYDNYGKGYLTVRNTYVVVIKDGVAPIIQFEKGVDSETVVTVKRGEKVQIKNYTVSDDISAVEKLRTTVFVTTDTGALLEWKVQDPDGYTFDKVGTFRYCVYCIDEAGNYSMAYYRVKVVNK